MKASALQYKPLASEILSQFGHRKMQQVSTRSENGNLTGGSVGKTYVNRFHVFLGCESEFPLVRGNALVSENSQAARSLRFGVSGGRPSFDGGERHKRMHWVLKPLITVRQSIASSSRDDLAPPQQAHLHDVPHHSARHPSHISYTPELGGSHTAIAAPLSSAVECYGCYKLTGPATVVVKTGRSGNSMEAYLGRGATLEWYHPDGNMVMTHVVSTATCCLLLYWETFESFSSHCELYNAHPEGIQSILCDLEGIHSALCGPNLQDNPSVFLIVPCAASHLNSGQSFGGLQRRAVLLPVHGAARRTQGPV